MDPLLASLLIFAGNFAPRGYLFCSGQILPIAQYAAVFSLLGTTYGGNGTSTFGLPDLRGRVPMHFGNGPGLTPYSLGEMGGTETNTLLVSNLPAHSHQLNATAEPGTTSSPSNAYLGNTGALDKEYNVSGTVISMNPGAIRNTGQSVPVNNIQPYLVLNFIIAMEGVFPSRN